MRIKGDDGQGLGKAATGTDIEFELLRRQCEKGGVWKQFQFRNKFFQQRKEAEEKKVRYSIEEL